MSEDFISVRCLALLGKTVWPLMARFNCEVGYINACLITSDMHGCYKGTVTIYIGWLATLINLYLLVNIVFLSLSLSSLSRASTTLSNN